MRPPSLCGNALLAQELKSTSEIVDIEMASWSMRLATR